MPVQPERIRCPACGETTVVRRQPVYDDGFRKIGETVSCVACGHRFADAAELPAAAPRRPSIFDDDDAPVVNVFGDDERQRCCRYCRHYIVNPFTQRCAVHNKRVQATDDCGRFERKPTPDADAE